MMFFLLLSIAFFILILTQHNTILAKNKEIKTLSTKYQNLLDGILTDSISPQKLQCEKGNHFWTKQTLPSYTIGPSSTRYFDKAHECYIKIKDGDCTYNGVVFKWETQVRSTIQDPTIKRCQYCDAQEAANHSTYGLQEFCPQTYLQAQLLQRTNLTPLTDK